ncbi:hypothetical protein [Methylobacterium sp. ID0610]|uniref:hypothetical protein n=1 Tax=Methylobacterium carpenticola TaxID=3344827 RepID=UPI0036B03315
MKNLSCRLAGPRMPARFLFGLCLTILAMGVCFRADMAEAQEIMPYEFTVLPVGTNLALGYYAYGHNTDYSIARGPTFRNSGLETHVGIARFVHYDEIAGIRAGVQVFQVFGGLQDAKIGGQTLPNAFGAQNITLSAFFWPYINEDTKTAVIVVGFLNPPDRYL